jgi:RNA polymerase sigma-70 factor, ECF subfamily
MALALQNGPRDIATVLVFRIGQPVIRARRGAPRPDGAPGGAGTSDGTSGPPADAPGGPAGTVYSSGTAYGPGASYGPGGYRTGGPAAGAIPGQPAARPVAARPAAAGRPPGWSPEEDVRLVELSRADPEAFGALYDRYCDQIYRFVYRRLTNHESAEDVTAEVFFKALRAIDSYRPTAGPFSGWLYRIAANAVVDHARARRITASLDVTMDAADRAAPVEEQVINRVEADKVWAAIDGLTEAQRVAVTLRFGRDLPIADIANHMGRSEGAVKLLLNRGLAAVRAQLASVPGNQEGQP